MEPLPVSMFQRASATLTSGADGWTPIGEWTWSRAIPGHRKCRVPGVFRRSRRRIHRPPAGARGGARTTGPPPHPQTPARLARGSSSCPHRSRKTWPRWWTRWCPGTRAGVRATSSCSGSVAAPTGTAFTSDRRLPTNDREMTGALERALREQPDVLVVVADGHVPAADAILSAAVGRLVIVGVVARTAPRALEVLLKSGANHRALAGVFKAGCSWRRVRDVSGRLKVIGDVLVGTTRVSALIEQDDIAGLQSSCRTTARRGCARSMRPLPRLSPGGRFVSARLRRLRSIGKCWCRSCVDAGVKAERQCVHPGGQPRSEACAGDITCAHVGEYAGGHPPRRSGSSQEQQRRPTLTRRSRTR